MAKVFISYSHIDAKIADEIVQTLSNQGIEYFRDIKDIDWGDTIDIKVQDGLRESSALLVIISPASLKSQWVPYEIGVAAGRGLKILPYLTHPSLDAPTYIRNLKYFTEIGQVQDFFSNNIIEDIPESVQVNSNSTLNKLFQKVLQLMPKLLNEMKEDIVNDKTHLVREFFILPSREILVNSSKPRFRYLENEHENLLNKIALLEEYGFVQDITPGNTPIYRFKEDFIALLTESRDI